jgi:hypothetical protein
VNKNSCGCVYAAPLDAKWNMVSFQAIVCGKEVDPETNNGQACDLNSIASPDNVAFITGTNTLIIYEDTSLHNNNMLWAMDVTKGVRKGSLVCLAAPLRCTHASSACIRPNGRPGHSAITAIRFCRCPNTTSPHGRCPADTLVLRLVDAFFVCDEPNSIWRANMSTAELQFMECTRAAHPVNHNRWPSKAHGF